MRLTLKEGLRCTSPYHVVGHLLSSLGLPGCLQEAHTAAFASERTKTILLCWQMHFLTKGENSFFCAVTRASCLPYKTSLLCILLIRRLFTTGVAEIVEILFAIDGIEVNALDNLSRSAMHWAAAGGKAEVLRILQQCVFFPVDVPGAAL